MSTEPERVDPDPVGGECDRPLRVVQVYHSAVVTAWRRRDDELRARGVELATVSARRWNEGGAMVELEHRPGEKVVGAATLGSHPFLFVFDPRPIWRALRGGPVDLIDVHEEPASFAALEVVVLALLAGVSAPFVLYSAQNIFKRYPLPFRWIERWLLGRAAAVHSCNDEVGRVLGRKGFAGEVANLGLGVDVERFVPGDSTGVGSASGASDGDVGERPFRVGYVGRIEEFKGIFTLLTAVAELDDVVLEFVGGGPDAGRLADAIVARRLGGRVAGPRFVAFDDLPEVYRSFDVLVVPSLDTPSWREQFGRVVVEAMACGVPVIVSDGGALAEVAGDAALVVRQRDAKALADAIVRVRDDAALRDRLVADGRRRATYFSWSAIGERQAALYHRVGCRCVSTLDHRATRESR